MRTQADRQEFPQLFRDLPNFHECFYNSIETRKTCFLFLLENTARKKELNPSSPGARGAEMIFYTARVLKRFDDGFQ